MSVRDLISAAYNKDAAAFETTLHAVMQEKMAAAIQSRFSPAVYEEEVELDEISSDLAKKYAQTATNPYHRDSLPNIANKLSDTTKTRTKIPGNSTVGSIQTAVKDHEDTLKKARRKLGNRVTGIERATARM